MVYVLDKNGQPLSETTRNGKVRRLLKENKARVVKSCPFTIQLLYDLEEEKLEDNLMNIIISDKPYMPIGITTVNSEKMSYEKFLKVAQSDEGLDVEELYFDIDDMTEEIYDSLSVYIKYGFTIKFFRYKTKPFIKEHVDLVDIKVPENRKDCLNIQLAPDIYTEGHILVSGMPGQGKTTLLKNMATQLLSKGTAVTFVSGIPVFDESDDIDVDKTTVDVKGLATIVSDLQKEMMSRFKMMEQEQVNHVFKLKNPVQPKVLIIDGIDFYTTSDDYRSVDTIKQGLGSIARLGRAAAIMLIVSCQRPSGSVISSDLKHNIMNNIVVGKIANAGVSMLMFDKEVHINIPFGMGIYQDERRATNSDADFSIFNIEDVKKYN